MKELRIMTIVSTKKTVTSGQQQSIPTSRKWCIENLNTYPFFHGCCVDLENKGTQKLSRSIPPSQGHFRENNIRALCDKYRELEEMQMILTSRVILIQVDEILSLI